MTGNRFCLPALVWLTLATSLAQSQLRFKTTAGLRQPEVFADFNSDGREDFIGVFKGCGPSDFALVLSTGDGAYGPAKCYSLPSGRFPEVTVGDFNGDGNADVLAGQGPVYEYLGSPSGELHLFTSLEVSAEGRLAADFNHDGKIDLLFTSLDYTSHIWFGNGDGTFTVGPDVPFGSGYTYLGDFDGDGKADVMSQTGDIGGNEHELLYGDGTGNFHSPYSWVDHAFYAVADLDGDGRSDLVGQPWELSRDGSFDYSLVTVMYGNADRTFARRDIVIDGCSVGIDPPSVADINGDGFNDIAAVELSHCDDRAPDTFNALLANADGTFLPEQVLFSRDTLGLSGPQVVRANQDSKPDLILSAEGQGTALFSKFSLLFQNRTAGDFPVCSPPNRFTGIKVCAPDPDVVAESPVYFSIGAANQTPGRKVEVWVDGKKLGEQLRGAFSRYTFLDARYELSSGQHEVTVISAGWDNLLQRVKFPLTVGPGHR